MKNGLFLFPDLQENTDTSVVLEFMKIKLSDLGRVQTERRDEAEEEKSIQKLYITQNKIMELVIHFFKNYIKNQPVVIPARTSLLPRA